MYCRDLKQEADRLGVELPTQDSVEHHALADALWTKLAWESIQQNAPVAHSVEPAVMTAQTYD